MPLSPVSLWPLMHTCLSETLVIILYNLLQSIVLWLLSFSLSVCLGFYVKLHNLAGHVLAYWAVVLFCALPTIFRVTKGKQNEIKPNHALYAKLIYSWSHIEIPISLEINHHRALKIGMPKEFFFLRTRIYKDIKISLMFLELHSCKLQAKNTSHFSHFCTVTVSI